MTSPDPAQIIASLNSARLICLRDSTIYPQVVPGVLPVISNTAHLQLRRWGADFLAETFASPVVSDETKQTMCLGVLDTLSGYLRRKEDMGEDEDASVVKSAVQCTASIYAFVFRFTIQNTSVDEGGVWAKMALIKSSILRRMDTAAAGVRICCIKFVAKVVQVQTPGMIADPRRQDLNEISLALVPRDHAVLPVKNLEAETVGLLDRLLGVLQDNLDDALIVTATLNSLAALVQKRATVAPKILMTVLNFNPLQLAMSGRPLTGKDKVALKSMTKTTMAFLVNILKKNPSHTQAGRIQQQVERMRSGLIEVLNPPHPAANGNGLKRPAPDEPIDGLDDSKRQRLDHAAANGSAPQQQRPPGPPPLPEGPVTYAQLYTLVSDPLAASFDVNVFPANLVSGLVSAILGSVEQRRLDDAINTVRARYLEVEGRSRTAVDAARPIIGGAFGSSPGYGPMTDVIDGEGVLDRLDHLPPQGLNDEHMAIGRFTLPPPEPLNEEQRAGYSKVALGRVFSTLAEREQSARSKPAGAKKTEIEKGFAKSAGGIGEGREGWLKLIIRLATRAPYALEAKHDTGEDGTVKMESDEQALVRMAKGAGGQRFDLASGIRAALLNYVMEDFRRRIDVAIAWLNEEWYSDRLRELEGRQGPGQQATNGNGNANGNGVHARPDDLPDYWPSTLLVLDALLPYLDTKDARVLLRFLSEIPALSQPVLERVARLANDPERVGLAGQALLYVVMLRPPCRATALDVVETAWRGGDEAVKAQMAKVLNKWRPEVLQEGKNEEMLVEEVKTEA